MQSDRGPLVQAEKEKKHCKPEQIHKMATIHSQWQHSSPKPFWVIILWIAQLCKQLFLSQFKKSHVIQQPTEAN